MEHSVYDPEKIKEEKMLKEKEEMNREVVHTN